MSDDSLRMVRYYVDRGRHAYRNRAIGCYVAGLVVLALTIAIAGAEFYTAGPMVLVGILVLTGAGFHLWYARLSWTRHPVLLALQSAPHDVTRAQVLSAVGKAARLDERQVEIGVGPAGTASVMLTMNVTELEGLGRALKAHCSDVRLGGFPAG